MTLVRRTIRYPVIRAVSFQVRHFGFILGPVKRSRLCYRANCSAHRGLQALQIADLLALIFSQPLYILSLFRIEQESLFFGRL